MIVEQSTEFVDLVVHKGLFFGRHLGLVGIHQLLEGRTARENVPIKANGPTTESNLFRLRNGRHDALGHAVETLVERGRNAQNGAVLGTRDSRAGGRSETRSLVHDDLCVVSAGDVWRV